MSTFMKRDRFPQVVLPYIELESIQSTGTQYIDTGFMPNQDTRVVMDAMLISKTTHAMYFGAKGDSGQTKEYMLLSLSSTDLNIRSDYYGTRITQSLNTIGVRVNIDKNKNVCIVNGVVMTNTYNTGISDYPLYLLAANYYGTAQYIMTGKVYSCQIYDNGILVRDFIPVQLKNTKEVGLWDKVEGVFYSNAGTGEFIGVKYNTPVNGSFLDYIQSSGTQFIDTRIYPKYNSRIVIDLSDLPGANQYIFGTRNAETSAASPLLYASYRTKSTVYIDYMGKRVSATVSDTVSRTMLDMNANVLTIAGVTITNNVVTSGECPHTLFLFAINDRDVEALYFSKYKMYSCKIYDAGLLVRDFFPCKTTGGEVGLWDKVEGVFYSNAGTGEFIAGEVAA